MSGRSFTARPRYWENLFGFDRSSQTFVIHLPGLMPVSFRPEAEVDGVPVGPLNWKLAVSTEKRAVFRAEDSKGVWELKVACAKTATIPRLALVLAGDLPVRPESARLKLVTAEGIPSDHVLVSGRKMGGCRAWVLPVAKKVSFESVFLLHVTTGGVTLQFSHPLRQSHHSAFLGSLMGKRVSRLTAETVFDNCRSGKLRSEPLTIKASGNGIELVQEWAESQPGPQQAVRRPAGAGWNSWDYYRWTVTEDEVLKNAEFIASDPVLSRHIKRIIIDDGWQYCYGEWEANSLFPSGMEKMARRLRRMGFTPGLWFAPTIAEPHSRLAQVRSEILAKGRSGLPCLAFSCMERKGFIVDPTHPETARWWFRIFRRYFDMGYRYFKLDFLGSTLNAPLFYDRSVAPGRMMNRIIEPIRRAVGRQSRILGCNYHFDGGGDGVDEVRIGSDIHAHWDSVKANAAAIGARFWCQGKFWTNDPDFAVCRGPETSDDPDREKLKPSLVGVRPEDRNLDRSVFLESYASLRSEEAEVLLSLVVMSGGAVNLSDNLTRLNETGLNLMRKVVAAPRGAPALPLDLFSSDLPAFWIQRVSARLGRLLIINWTDQKQDYEVNLSELGISAGSVRNFWTDEEFHIRRGAFSMSLKARSCLLLETGKAA